MQRGNVGPPLKLLGRVSFKFGARYAVYLARSLAAPYQGAGRAGDSRGSPLFQHSRRNRWRVDEVRRIGFEQTLPSGGRFLHIILLRSNMLCDKVFVDTLFMPLWVASHVHFDLLLLTRHPDLDSPDS